MATFLICLAAGLGTAQDQARAYKLAEFDKNGGGSCDEFFRIAHLVDEVDKNPGSKGLIVIYAGDKTNRFGNVMAYAGEAQEYFERITKSAPGKFTVVAAEGKEFFNEEFWIIPAGAEPPNITRAVFDWSGLTGKYRFSYTCLQCEPSYYRLGHFQANFEDYADILRKYPNYRGLITVNDMWEVERVRSELTEKNKLPRNRYRIQILKPGKDEFPGSVYLFIVPNIS